MAAKFLHALFITIILLQSHASLSEYTLYKDPNPPVEDRVEDLLRRMNLEEKIGQMTQADREDLTGDLMRRYNIGSALSGGGSVPRTNATAVDWIEMVNSLQMGAMGTRLGIPMIYGVDAVHGHNNVYGATVFPHNVGLGATRLARENSRELAMNFGHSTSRPKYKLS